MKNRRTTGSQRENLPPDSPVATAYKDRWWPLPLLLGVLAFCFVGNARMLDFGDTAWLSGGDNSQHFLGWDFFRHSPWRFPIGLNPDYGLEIGSSIFYSDSLPLFAFPFKAVRTWLPDSAQYFGLWILLSFVLQAWFGWKLACLVTPKPALRAMFCVMVLSVPPFLMKIPGHMALGGHWVVLAALWLCLKKDSRGKWGAWMLLCLLATMIHSYLFFMAGFLWAADLLGRGLVRRQKWIYFLGEAAGVLAVSLIGLWMAGFFALGSGYLIGGFGTYSMNLLAPLDSDGFSLFLPDIPSGSGNYEGYNYFGLGGLFLVGTGASLVWRRRKRLPIWESPELLRWLPLALAGLALTVFALSHVLMIGTWRIKFPLHPALENAANMLRSSGRLYWPVHYSLLWLGFNAVVKFFPPVRSCVVIGLITVVQLVDLSPLWAAQRRQFHDRPREWRTALHDPIWEILPRHYEKLRLFPNSNESAHWRDLSSYAVFHGLKTDAVYLARIDEKLLLASNKKVARQIRTGFTENDSFYVFDDFSAIAWLLQKKRGLDVLVRVDGLNLLVPGGMAHSDLVECARRLPPLEIKVPTFPPHTTISFRTGGNGLACLGFGWSHPKDRSTWNVSETAMLLMAVDAPADRFPKIRLRAHGFVPPQRPLQKMRVSINGYEAATLEFSLALDGVNEVTFSVPPAALDPTSPRQALEMFFEVDPAIRPSSVGRGDDTRPLGIVLTEMDLIE